MLDDKIVVFGMSCSGKTTFSKTLEDHFYYCFDAMFRWELVETLGVSIEANFKKIQQTCTADKFVLDGWHLADKECRFLPEGARVYVVYAPYDQIIEQYRVDVWSHEQHRPMYHRWYKEIDYEKLNARYWKCLGDSLFVEMPVELFLQDIVNEL